MADLRGRSILGADSRSYTDAYRDQPSIESTRSEIPEITPDERKAAGMGDFRRGVIGTELSLKAGDLYAESDDALNAGRSEEAARLVSEAQALEQRGAAYERDISSFQDVKDPLDAIDYVQGGLGSLLPTMAAPMAAGMAGAAAGSVFGPVGAFVGGAVGAAKPAFDMEASEQASSQHADEYIMANTTPQERINERRIKASTNALLEVAFPTILGGRLFGAGAKKLAKEAGSEVVEAGFKRTKTMVKEGLLVEGNTELAQTISGQQSLNRLNPERDTSQDWVEQIDSFILGAMGGTAISGATVAPGYVAEKIRDKADQLDLDQQPEFMEEEDGTRRPFKAGDIIADADGNNWEIDAKDAAYLNLGKNQKRQAFIPEEQTDELAGKAASPDDSGFIPDENSNKIMPYDGMTVDEAIGNLEDDEFIAFTHFGDKQQEAETGPQQSFTEEQKDKVYSAAVERMTALDEEIRTLEKFGLTPKTLKEKKKLRADLENAGANLLRDMSPGAIEAHKNARKETDIINEAESQDEKTKSLNLFITKGGVSEILKRGIKNVDAHLQKLINDDVITKEEAFAAEATPLGDAIINSGGSQQDLENHASDMIRDLKKRAKNEENTTDLAALEDALDSETKTDLRSELNKYFDIRGPADFTPKEKGMQAVSKNMTTGPKDTKKLDTEEAIRVKRTDGKVHLVYKKDLQSAGARRFGWDKNNTLEALSADPSFVGVVDKNGKVIKNDDTAIYEALKMKRPKGEEPIVKGDPQFESLGAETLDDKARTIRREIATAQEELKADPKNRKKLKAYESALERLYFNRETTEVQDPQEAELKIIDRALAMIADDLQLGRTVRRLEERVATAKGMKKAGLMAKLKVAQDEYKRGGFDESTFESLRTKIKKSREALLAGEATASQKEIKKRTLKQRAAGYKKNKAETAKLTREKRARVKKSQNTGKKVTAVLDGTIGTEAERREAKTRAANAKTVTPNESQAEMDLRLEKEARSLGKTTTKQREELVRKDLAKKKAKTPPGKKPVTKATKRVILKGNSRYKAKDQAKSDKANKFIGQGSENSSTNQYRKSWGDRANTGEYTSKDVVFVSVEGARRGRKDLPIAELQKAIAAGATIVGDNLANRSRNYNIGERQLAKVLETNGYTEVEGVWTKGTAKAPSSQTTNIWAGSNENKGLSNLAIRKFTYKGKAYKSVEHAYQTWKSGTFDQATYDAYNKSLKAKIRGKAADRNKNIGIMEEVMRASFEQNPAAQKLLLGTGDSTLTHKQDRGIWNKKFPELLTKIRTELAEGKPAKTPPAATSERPTGVSVPMANMHKRTMASIGSMNMEKLSAAYAATKKAVDTTLFAPFKELKKVELKAIWDRRQALEQAEYEAEIEQEYQELEKRYADLEKKGLEIQTKLEDKNSKLTEAEQEELWEDGSEINYEMHVVGRELAEAKSSRNAAKMNKTAKPIKEDITTDTTVPKPADLVDGAKLPGFNFAWTTTPAGLFRSFSSFDNLCIGCAANMRAKLRKAGYKTIAHNESMSVNVPGTKRFSAHYFIIAEGKDGKRYIIDDPQSNLLSFDDETLVGKVLKTTYEPFAIEITAANMKKHYGVDAGAMDGAWSPADMTQKEYIAKQIKQMNESEVSAAKQENIVRSDGEGDWSLSPLFKKEVIVRDKLESMLDVVFGKGHNMIVERRPKDGNPSVWGQYDQGSDQITIYSDNVPNMKVAILTAWHETYHRGARQAFNRGVGTVPDYSQGNSKGVKHVYTLAMYKMLKDASSNPTVAAIAKQMGKQRGLVGALAVEEALVEIGAAIDGAGWAHLETRYSIKVPPGMRGELVTLWRRFVDMLMRPIGLNSKTTSDAEILHLLKNFKAGNATPQKAQTAAEVAFEMESEKYAESLTEAVIADNALDKATDPAVAAVAKELGLNPKSKNTTSVAWSHFARTIGEKFVKAREQGKKPSFGLEPTLEKLVLETLEASVKAEAEAIAAYEAAQEALIIAYKKEKVADSKTRTDIKKLNLAELKQYLIKNKSSISSGMAREIKANISTLAFMSTLGSGQLKADLARAKAALNNLPTDLIESQKRRIELIEIAIVATAKKPTPSAAVKKAQLVDTIAKYITNIEAKIKASKEKIESYKKNNQDGAFADSIAKLEATIKRDNEHLDGYLADYNKEINSNTVKSEGLPPTAAQISRTRRAKYKGMRLAQLNRELKTVNEKLIKYKNNKPVSKALQEQLGALQAEIKKKDAARIAAKKDLQFSNQSQGGYRRGTYRTVKQARKGNKALDAAAKKGERLVRKMLGDTLTGPIDWFLHKKEGGAYGSYSASTQGKFIRAAIDSMDPLSTLFHESMHALAKELSSLTEGKVQYKKIAKLAMSPHIQMQLRNLLKDSPAAIAQLKDPNESVAYMFQFWATRESTGFRIQPAAKNTFKRWAESFAQLVGYVTKTQAAQEIFEAFVGGDLATIPGIQDTLRNVQHKRAAQAVSSIATPLGKTIDQLFKTPIDRLKNTKNKALITLAKKYFATVKAGGKLGLIQRTAQQHGHWLNRFESTLQKHKATTKDMQRALRNLQAGKATTPLELEIRGLFEDLYKYASTGVGHIQALVKDEDGRLAPRKLAYTPNFFPRVWNSQAIIEQSDKLRKLLKSEGNLSDSEIDNFFAAVRKGEGIVDLGAATSSLTPAFSSANPRTFDFITDENAHKFVEFQERDMHQIVSRYIRQVVHRREHGRAFGSDGKGVQKLLDAAEKSGATPEQMEMARKAVEAMDGTLGTKSVSALQRNTMVAAMSVVNFAVLPLALFSSLVDPLGVLLRTGSIQGTLDTYRASVKQLYNDTKHIKGSGQILTEYLGIIESETMLEVIGNTYNGMFMNQTLRKANSFFFKAIGLEQWTRGTRIGALAASQLYLRDNYADPKVLKELNLQPGDIQKDTIPNPMEMPEGARRKRVEEALFRMVDESILRPSSATRPIWMSDLRFSLFGHLKQFTFTFHNMINKQVAKNFREQRASGATIASAALAGWPLLTYVPVMIAADMVRAVVAGRSDDDDDDSYGKMFNSGLQRSGILGLGSFIMDAQRDYKYGNLPINTVAGPTIGKGYDLVRTAMNDDASFGNTLASLIPGAALWKGWLN